MEAHLSISRVPEEIAQLSFVVLQIVKFTNSIGPIDQFVVNGFCHDGSWTAFLNFLTTSGIVPENSKEIKRVHVKK